MSDINDNVSDAQLLGPGPINFLGSIEIFQGKIPTATVLNVARQLLNVAALPASINVSLLGKDREFTIVMEMNKDGVTTEAWHYSEYPIRMPASDYEACLQLNKGLDNMNEL